MAETTISVVIPTLARGATVIETVGKLAALTLPPAEILVVDQTREHPAEVEERLAALDAEGTMRWIRLPEPTIPGAMNRGLLEARSPIVLFLDDDIEPMGELVAAHLRNYEDAGVMAVAGRVVEMTSRKGGHTGEAGHDVLAGGGPSHARPARPLGTTTTGKRKEEEDGEGHEGGGRNPKLETRNAFLRDLEFDFGGEVPAEVANVMAGNLSVRRDRAIAIGGFDENFTGGAYRFETDFARRLVHDGGRIRFDPEASIRHLKLQTGGLRSYGDFLRSPSPAHSAGDYYFAWLHATPRERRRYTLRRLRRNVLTRFHLRHPWWIPVKLVGELRGMRVGARMARRGRRLLVKGEG